MIFVKDWCIFELIHIRLYLVINKLFTKSYILLLFICTYPIIPIIYSKGGTVVNDIELATILITPKQLARTPKLLAAISRGIPIVTEAYLKNMRETNIIPGE